MTPDQCFVIATTVPVLLVAFVVESRSLSTWSKRTNHDMTAWFLKVYELITVAISFYLETVAFDGVDGGLNNSDGQQAEQAFFIVFGLLCLYIAGGRVFRKEDAAE